MKRKELSEIFLRAAFLMLLLGTITCTASAAIAPPGYIAPVTTTATMTPRTVTCTAPCECLTTAMAIQKFGSAYIQCLDSPCGYTTAAGANIQVPMYCYKPASAPTTTVTPIDNGTFTVTLVCPTGQKACQNRYCADLSSDRNNCGSCGIICPSNMVCIDGQCAVPGISDNDGDNIPLDQDNCPYLYNKDQWDQDNDGVGDDCDNCEYAPNPDQKDTDGDIIGDACDLCPLKKYIGDSIWEEDGDAPGHIDADEDGVGDRCDNCPNLKNPDQKNSDDDPIGDACDFCPTKTESYCKNASNLKFCEDYTMGMEANWSDSDKDTFGYNCDNCPFDYNPEQLDLDNDGVGDECDACPMTPGGGHQDSDGDGIPNDCDLCPFQNCDKTNTCHEEDAEAPVNNDQDNDGIGDVCDNCPKVSNSDQKDSDGDNVGNTCDNCMFIYNPNQVNSDGDAVGDACQCYDGIKEQNEQGIDCGGVCALPCTGDLCSITPLPVQFSYRNWNGKNWLSPVKDQGLCGSCYAQAAIGAMEAKYNLEKNSLLNINLAEQYFVSPCFTDTGSCLGGNAQSVLEHLKTDGVLEETCFPYTSTNCVHSEPNNDYPVCNFAGHCSQPQDCGHCTNNLATWKITSYGGATGTVDQLKRNLLCKGPLVVCSAKWWHCVVLVGWDDQQNSWIVKNSWGESHKMGGYETITYSSTIGKEFLGWAYSVKGVGVV